MKRFRNISTALTLVLAISFLIICLLFSFSLSHLYGELSRQRQHELSQAAAQAAAYHTSTLYRQAKALVASCANAPIAGKQPASVQNRTPKEKRAMLDLLETMTEYCSTSAAKQYVLRLAFFHENGILVQYNPTSIRSASPEIELFLQSRPYLALKETGAVANMGLYPRLNQENEWSFQYMLPVYGQTSSRVAGYLLGEFRLELFADQMPATGSVSYALSDDKGNLLTLPAGLLETEGELGSFLLSGQSGFARSGSWLYTVDRARIPDSDFTVSCIMKVTSPRQEKMQFAAMLCLILLGTLLLALICIGICTRNISIPADRLRNRLARVAENDLSPAPELEHLPGGFAQMGAAVNQMTVSIQGLMERAVAEANAKKDSEIAALQSQIYPHFIYNTLDSIHWMAKLQKNIGICTLTESLTALLRNLVRSPGERIPLREELNLLRHYITIQSVRYMDSFDCDILIPEELQDYRIIKFVLQPLVENAIFHGVEPADHFCKIVISATAEDGVLHLVVEDNGVGMDQRRLAVLNGQVEAADKGGIGAANVRSRIKLVYGEKYGLFYESESGRGTRAVIRIPLEK